MKIKKLFISIILLVLSLIFLMSADIDWLDGTHTSPDYPGYVQVTAGASSTLDGANQDWYYPEKAFEYPYNSSWMTEDFTGSYNQAWYYVDLKNSQQVNDVRTFWEGTFYALSYAIYTSNNLFEWVKSKDVTNDTDLGWPVIDDVTIDAVTKRFVGIYMYDNNNYRYGIRNLKVRDME